MLDTNKLGLSLLKAESEEEVSSILSSKEYVSAGVNNSENWYPLDGRETNSNVITNQSSNGGKAATELITNMVDAMLTKCCLEENIDPKGENAPKTMYEAVDRFVVNLSGGKIIKADAKWLRTYSKQNLVIGITASKKNGKPCYTFADNGEGQHPEDFPETFLSLKAKNKSEIPFVQGKYNMGSSGVLGFCGTQWYKLIVSRRYDKKGEWGWTLIRKHEVVSGGMPYAEYFAPSNQIPIFSGVEKIFPFHKNNVIFEDFFLETGTVVKLYDFYTGKNFTSASFRSAREAFNENLVETILPFRIYDFRWKADPNRSGPRAQGIDARAFYGMEFLLARSHADEKDMQAHETEDDDDVQAEENVVFIESFSGKELGKISVSAVPIRRESARTNWYRKSNARIFHHVNGQVQYKQARGFLTQCGLSALKDRVVIFVDASYLHDSAHQNVWKGDRENIRETPIGEHYKDEVKHIIKNSTYLKDLQHRIALEEYDTAAKEGSKDLIKALVERDKNFSMLLDGKIPDLPVPSGTSKPVDLRNRTKYSPSFIRLINKKDSNISLPINRERLIPCSTDAPLNYFNRAENQGDLYFENDGIYTNFDFRNSYDNKGQLLVVIRPIAESVEVGDKYTLRIGLKDEAMSEPCYTESIEIEISKRKSSKSSNPKTPKTPPDLPQKGLPPYQLLTKDGRSLTEDFREIPRGSDEEGPVKTKIWEDSEYNQFGKDDGGYVQDLGEGEVMYYINYDNSSFQNHLASLKSKDEKGAATQKYILGMRIAMLGAEHALNSQPEDEESNQFDEDIFRRLVAQGASSVVLTLCEGLPKSFDLFSSEGDDE